MLGEWYTQWKRSEEVRGPPSPIPPYRTPLSLVQLSELCVRLDRKERKRKGGREQEESEGGRERTGGNFLCKNKLKINSFNTFSNSF